MILLIVDSTLQILPQNLINMLCLAINLRMECRRKFDIYHQYLKERFWKFWYKLGSLIKMISSNRPWYRYNLSKKSLVVSSWKIALLHGTKCAKYVSQSRIIWIISNEFYGSRSIIKSINITIFVILRLFAVSFLFSIWG